MSKRKTRRIHVMLSGQGTIELPASVVKAALEEGGPLDLDMSVLGEWIRELMNGLRFEVESEEP